MKNKQGFSIFKGTTFCFEVEGYNIEAWFSMFSGMEKVYVNGELVMAERNLNADSTNYFMIQGCNYSTNLKAESLLNGPYICTLYKEGDVIKKKKLSFEKNKFKKQSILMDVIYFNILGAIWHGLMTTFGFPAWPFFIIFIIFLAVKDYFNNGNYFNIKFENLE